MRIIVTGLIAQYPLGGVAWDYLQYILGFSLLGHEVYYIEDTGQSPFVPELGGLTDTQYFARAPVSGDTGRLARRRKKSMTHGGRHHGHGRKEDKTALWIIIGIAVLAAVALLVIMLRKT